MLVSPLLTLSLSGHPCCSSHTNTHHLWSRAVKRQVKLNDRVDNSVLCHCKFSKSFPARVTLNLKRARKSWQKVCRCKNIYWNILPTFLSFVVNFLHAVMPLLLLTQSVIKNRSGVLSLICNIRSAHPYSLSQWTHGIYISINVKQHNCASLTSLCSPFLRTRRIQREIKKCNFSSWCVVIYAIYAFLQAAQAYLL